MFQDNQCLSHVAECLHEARSRWQLGLFLVPYSCSVGCFLLPSFFCAFSRSLPHLWLDQSCAGLPMFGSGVWCPRGCHTLSDLTNLSTPGGKRSDRVMRSAGGPAFPLLLKVPTRRLAVPQQPAMVQLQQQLPLPAQSALASIGCFVTPNRRAVLLPHHRLVVAGQQGDTLAFAARQRCHHHDAILAPLLLRVDDALTGYPDDDADWFYSCHGEQSSPATREDTLYAHLWPRREPGPIHSLPVERTFTQSALRPGRDTCRCSERPQILSWNPGPAPRNDRGALPSHLNGPWRVVSLRVLVLLPMAPCRTTFT